MQLPPAFDTSTAAYVKCDAAATVLTLLLLPLLLLLLLLLLLPLLLLLLLPLPPTPYSREVEALPGGAAALESQVAALERAAGCRFAPGSTPGRRIMAHLREPLRMSYRPAVLYGLTELMSVAKRLSLAKRGARRRGIAGPERCAGFFCLSRLPFCQDLPTWHLPGI